MSKQPHLAVLAGWAALLLLSGQACTTIAGLDDDYTLVPESGAGGGASSGGSSGPGSAGSGGGGGSSGQGGASSTSSASGGGAGGTSGSGGQGGGGSTCGDGVIDANEECDDQNLDVIDGCAMCQVGCPPGAAEDPSAHHCYLFDEKERSWDDANADCNATAFHLATITSMAELAFVASMVKQDAWIGGQMVMSWAWVTGEPWGFMAWDNAQPSGNGACLELRFDSGKWNDQPCNELNHAICEWAPPGTAP